MHKHCLNSHLCGPLKWHTPSKWRETKREVVGGEMTDGQIQDAQEAQEEKREASASEERLEFLLMSASSSVGS